MSVERLRQEHHVKTRWVHFPLHPETPDEGIAISDLFKDRSADEIANMAQQMRTLMADAGLPYGNRTMTYNSRLAQELGAWADDVAPGSAIHDALFTAYFVDNRNIGDIQVLLVLAAEAGLDVTTAEQVLTTRRYSPQVNEDWQRAWQSGVTGVPTFTSRELYVVGCQPYEVLVRFVDHLRGLAAGSSA